MNWCLCRTLEIYHEYYVLFLLLRNIWIEISNAPLWEMVPTNVEETVYCNSSSWFDTSFFPLSSYNMGVAFFKHDASVLHKHESGKFEMLLKTPRGRKGEDTLTDCGTRPEKLSSGCDEQDAIFARVLVFFLFPWHKLHIPIVLTDCQVQSHIPIDKSFSFLVGVLKSPVKLVWFKIRALSQILKNIELIFVRSSIFFCQIGPNRGGPINRCVRIGL